MLGEHYRHYDTAELVALFLIFGGNDESGTAGVSELHYDLVAGHVGEDFLEEGGLEADFEGVTIVRAGNLLIGGNREAEVLGGDLEDIAVQGELYLVGALVGTDGDTADYIEEGCTVDLEEIGGVLGAGVALLGRCAGYEAAQD
ncbi:MAG: hypothetical protein MJY56_08485 [Bacteroidales bacterium]|nr:hypothetical protein [Bacteroidales bacterium]